MAKHLLQIYFYLPTYANVSYYFLSSLAILFLLPAWGGGYKIVPPIIHHKIVMLQHLVGYPP